MMASEDERRTGNRPELASERERLAGNERDLAGADRDPAAAAGVTRLERRARRFLHVYPTAYRRERGEEIIGTLLEVTPDGRTWPQVRDVRALAVSGLKARAAQNRQRTVGANLRVAVMAGLAIYTAIWITTYVDGALQGFVWIGPGAALPAGWMGWPAAVTALFAGATVVLAWTAPRVGLLAAALAGAAVVVFAVANHDALQPHLLQVLGVAGLAALAPRAGHPSRHWLWLPGVIAIAGLVELAMGYGWLGYWWRYAAELSLVAVAAVGIVWIAVDARLMVAVLTILAVTVVQVAVMEFPSRAAILTMLPVLLVVATLTAATGWLLRRQSARASRAD